MGGGKLMAIPILCVNPKAEIGGSDASLVDLVSHLDASRYAPVVLLPHSGPFDATLRQAGATVVFGPVAPLRRFSRPVEFLTWLRNLVRSFRSTRALIRHWNIRLVHVNSIVTLAPALATASVGVPLVWHLRELVAGPPLVQKMLVGIVARTATRILAISSAVARQLPLSAHNRLHIVPNGIDLTRFDIDEDRASSRHRLGLPQHAPITCFVGRLAPWKGAHVYLDACELVAVQLPDAHFLLVGSSFPKYQDYTQQLLARTKRAPLAGRVTVFLNQTDIPGFMSAADVVLHCSVTPEPFGRVVIEAMAARRPIIAAAEGGVPEIITSADEGLLVPPGDAEALAEAALSVLNDPDKARRLGEAGYRRASAQFTTARLAARVDTVYASLLDSA
ncbi:MAG: hypothetical protein CL878_02395 [Dehalococcoidia bacterium]|nr:hypothetical protein [Dehalococcoidia bacterium]